MSLIVLMLTIIEMLRKWRAQFSALNGVRGVKFTTETGRKTWCGAEKNGGIHINIDPDELGGERRPQHC